MYLRHTTRKKDGKVHRYWRLVRSVRVGRRVIQQTVAQLGELDEHGRVEARGLARRLIGAPEQAPLFDDGSEHLTVPVRLKGIRVERSRRFGDVYLALALWRGTGLEELCERLLPAGKERIAWAKMAAVLVAARLCEPSSELHIAEDWYRRTALCDLLQLGEEAVNKDRLFGSPAGVCHETPPPGSDGLAISPDVGRPLFWVLPGAAGAASSGVSSAHDAGGDCQGRERFASRLVPGG